MKILIRISFFIYRFFISIENLGILNSFKIFFLSRINKKEMFLNLNEKKFYFVPIIHHGSYSRFTFPQYLILDKPNDGIEYIIDGGANTGSQAIRFINTYKNLKKMVCIEPDKNNFNLLKKNLNYKNVENLHAALDDYDKQKIFITNMTEKSKINGKPTNISELITTSKNNNNENQNNAYVESISINTIVDKYSLPRIDFFKCDLNGFESNMFKNNLEWVKICRCVAFNNADLNNDIETIIKKFFLVKKFNVYNIDQMLILIDSQTKWSAVKKYIKF